MSERYLVLDASGTVVNVVQWDGEAPWEPGEGLTLTPSPEGVGPRWRLIEGAWMPPDPEPED